MPRYILRLGLDTKMKFYPGAVSRVVWASAVYWAKARHKDTWIHFSTCRPASRRYPITGWRNEGVGAARKDTRAAIQPRSVWVSAMNGLVQDVEGWQPTTDCDLDGTAAALESSW